MELIDFAEQQGKTNFEWQTKVNETIRQETNITLGFLMTGGGAALAWAVQHAAIHEPNVPLIAAVLVLGIWLFGLAMALVFRCLNFVESMPPANQPSNIYQPKFDTLGMREIQLQYLEEAILYAIEKGQPRAKSLRRVRLFICLSPAVFLLAWWLSHECLR